jgi:6-pyruvoyltetrahydropterin/6-carboxytetrahydropterin synthase
MTVTASREHTICTGHRVVGQGGKCESLHGHNYTITFTARGVQDATDRVGRVVDFSVLKSQLCEWLEENWDHKTLIWDQDPWLDESSHLSQHWANHDEMGIILVPFNPTAENMAQYLLSTVAPSTILRRTFGVEIISVKVQETLKCSAEVSL